MGVSSNCLKAGADVFTLMKFLGHADARSSQVYVNMTCDDVRRAVEATPFFGVAADVVSRRLDDEAPLDQAATDFLSVMQPKTPLAS